MFLRKSNGDTDAKKPNLPSGELRRRHPRFPLRLAQVSHVMLVNGEPGACLDISLGGVACDFGTFNPKSDAIAAASTQEGAIFSKITILKQTVSCFLKPAHTLRGTAGF